MRARSPSKEVVDLGFEPKAHTAPGHQLEQASLSPRPRGARGELHRDCGVWWKWPVFKEQWETRTGRPPRGPAPGSRGGASGKAHAGKQAPSRPTRDVCGVLAGAGGQMEATDHMPKYLKYFELTNRANKLLSKTCSLLLH